MAVGLTPKVVAYLLTQEGMVPEAYLDTEKVWTWAGGIATTSGYNVLQYKDNPQPLDVCCRATIDHIKAHYLPSVTKAFIGHNLAENEVAGALSFHWRNGSILTAQWVKDYMAGKPTTAKADFMQWTNHGKQVDRAETDRDLFFDNKWPASLTVPVYRVAKPSYVPVQAKLVDLMPILQSIMGGG